MAAAFQQDEGNVVVSPTAGTCAINGVAAGSLLTVDVRMNAPGETCTVADDKNAGNYNQDEIVTAGALTLGKFSMPNSASGNIVVTVTITGGAGTSVIMISVTEVTGIVTTSPKDKSVSAAPTSATPNSGNVATTSQANEYLSGAVAFGAPDDTNYGVGGSLTNFRQSVSDRMWTGDAVISAVGTPSAGFVLSASHTCAVILVTYKAAATAKTATDTLALSDSAVSITQRISTASDTVAVTDSAVSITQRLAAGTDTVALSDSAVSTTNRISVAVDGVTLTDSAVGSHSAAHSPTATDTLTLTDSAVSTTNRTSTASDSVALSDSAVCVGPTRARAATPGRKSRRVDPPEQRRTRLWLPSQVRGETEEEKRQRRIAQGIIPAEVQPQQAQETDARAANQFLAKLLADVARVEKQLEETRAHVLASEQRAALAAELAELERRRDEVAQQIEEMDVAFVASLLLSGDF